MLAKKLNSGTASFNQKHVGSSRASDQQLIQQAKSRFTTSGRRSPSKSTVIRGKPYFRNGKEFGDSRVSIIPRDVITVNKNGKVTKERMTMVKGNVGHRTGRNGQQNEEAGQVNHYDGTTRDPQIKAVVVGGAIGMAIHVADHHIYKNGKVKVDKATLDLECGKQGEVYAGALAAQAVTVSAKYGEKAGAEVFVGRAEASTKGIPGTGDLLAPNASADVLSANVGVEVGVLGLKMDANATVGRAQIGFKGTPLAASAAGPTVGASAGFHVSHIGGYIEASVGEVSVGPFAVRAGVKFGGGIENGIPVVHTGAASAPCIIQ